MLRRLDGLRNRAPASKPPAIRSACSPCSIPGAPTRSPKTGWRPPTLASSLAPGLIVRHSLATRVRSLAFKVDFRLRQFASLGFVERNGYIRRMFRDLYSTFSIPANRIVKGALYRFCERWHLPKPRLLRDSSIVTYEWLRQYRVQPYRGDIELIRPGGLAVPPDSDPNCGWRALTTGRIQTTFVPGDRSTMFLMPNLSLLADVLNQFMARA